MIIGAHLINEIAPRNAISPSLIVIRLLPAAIRRYLSLRSYLKNRSEPKGCPAMSDQQLIEEFNRVGYIAIPDAFNPDEVAKMQGEADAILERIINSSIAHSRRSGYSTPCGR